MAAVLDISPSERELESMWRSFHRAWVAASDELARLEARLLAAHEQLDPAEMQLLETLRRHERQARALLDMSERRILAFRSRTARYRRRYA